MVIFDKKWFPLIVTMLCVFAGPGVLFMLKYPLGEAGGGAIFRFHPVSYFLVLLTIYNLVRYNYHIGELKKYYGFTLCVLIVLIYSLTFGSSKGNLFLFNVLFCPSLIIFNFQFINYKTINIKIWKQLMFVLQFFFYAECILAILEHVIHAKLFPINETAILFRSNAFQGHPLNNSLFLIFFSLFFYSYEKTFVKRMIIIGLTVGALASFGVRSGLVTYSLGITLISLKFMENGKFNFSMKNIATLVILVLSVVYIVFYTPLGARITSAGTFNDNSSSVRYGVYNMFNYISLQDIIWGVPQETIDYLMYINGIEIIENFWIIWIFKYGVVFTVYLGISFILFFYRMTKLAFPVKEYERLVMLCVFLLAASSNNSLAVNTTVICAITILCLTQYNILRYRPVIKKKPRPVQAELVNF
ncbi:VpsF family polysaccharide biosynthesis protein [Dyadobacter bucti]|uniref:VpsF family polysaccharide biosynthesis protein n=1 Tax=Dyadobacter bucti TaxID=2572203 RepID=UPI003F6EA0F2